MASCCAKGFLGIHFFGKDLAFSEGAIASFLFPNRHAPELPCRDDRDLQLTRRHLFFFIPGLQHSRRHRSGTTAAEYLLSPAELTKQPPLFEGKQEILDSPSFDAKIIHRNIPSGQTLEYDGRFLFDGKPLTDPPQVQRRCSGSYPGLSATLGPVTPARSREDKGMKLQTVDTLSAVGARVEGDLARAAESADDRTDSWRHHVQCPDGAGRRHPRG